MQFGLWAPRGHRRYLRWIGRLAAAALVSGAVVWGVYAWSQTIFLKETQDRARATLALYTEGLEGAFRKYEAIPELLARRAEVIALFRDKDAPAAVARANRLSEDVNRTTGAEATYFMDTDGHTFAASNWRGDLPFVGQNFSYRPYFQAAMEGRLGRYFALGTTSNKRGYYFAYPVKDEAETLGAVVVKVDVERIEAAWATGGDDVMVTDANGVVFITSRPEWRFKTLFPLSEAAIGQITRDRQYNLADLTPLDLAPWIAGGAASGLVRIRAGGRGPGPNAEARQATEYLVEARHVPEADWTVHILADTRSARAQVTTTVAISVLVCLIAILSAAIVEQHRRRLVDRIALERAAAERLEQNVRERTADLTETNLHLEREIAEREVTEAALRRTQEELVQAGKLAALGQMSAALSHEFNQPLAAIRSYAENAAMLIGRGRQEEASDNCARIRDLTGRMADISKHLNAFARKPRGQLGPVRLDQVIQDTLESLHGRLDAARARVELAGEARVPPVIAGRVRLQQVLTNLLLNALDAMANQAAPRIEITVEAAANQVRVAIRDHGDGIAQEVLPTIFDPFVTTKQVGSGLGLGLSISYNIVKDFGGSLSAANHPDGGALFVLELAAADVPAALAANA